MINKKTCFFWPLEGQPGKLMYRGGCTIVGFFCLFLHENFQFFGKTKSKHIEKIMCKNRQKNPTIVYPPYKLICPVGLPVASLRFLEVLDSPLKAL